MFEKTCKVCGDSFVLLDCDRYMYKVSVSKSTTHYFCSYNCRQKYLREQERKKERIKLNRNSGGKNNERK